MRALLCNAGQGDLLIFATKPVPATNFCARGIPNDIKQLQDESGGYADALRHNQVASDCFRAASK